MAVLKTLIRIPTDEKLGTTVVYGHVLGWLRGRVRAPSPAGNDFLLSKPHFQAVLQRERLRSDRTLIGFSLLKLTLGKRAARGSAHVALVGLLEQRIRATDTAGWFADGEIGIILPATPVASAWKLVDDLSLALAELKLSAQFELYAYPSSDSTDQKPLEETVGSGVGFATPSLPARPAEMLFVQKLPHWKRAIDLTVATVALVVTFPFLLLVALAIKATSRGPILYAQRRDGLGGRRFWIYKFRTMVVGADACKAKLRAMSEQDGPAFKLKNDPRVTPIGRLFRRTCIDELPQLFNVLRGDMSLVGPRPLCSNEAKHCNQWQRRRLDVTPGLTCSWQVYGGTKVTFTEWMRMDLRYGGNRSLLKDLHLLFLTFPSVIRRDGVY